MLQENNPKTEKKPIQNQNNRGGNRPNSGKYGKYSDKENPRIFKVGTRLNLDHFSALKIASLRTISDPNIKEEYKPRLRTPSGLIGFILDTMEENTITLNLKPLEEINPKKKDSKYKKVPIYCHIPQKTFLFLNVQFAKYKEVYKESNLSQFIRFIVEIWCSEFWDNEQKTIDLSKTKVSKTK